MRFTISLKNVGVNQPPSYNITQFNEPLDEGVVKKLFDI